MLSCVTDQSFVQLCARGSGLAWVDNEGSISDGPENDLRSACVLRSSNSPYDGVQIQTVMSLPLRLITLGVTDFYSRCGLSTVGYGGDAKFRH